MFFPCVRVSGGTRYTHTEGSRSYGVAFACSTAPHSMRTHVLRPQGVMLFQGAGARETGPVTQTAIRSHNTPTLCALIVCLDLCGRAQPAANPCARTSAHTHTRTHNTRSREVSAHAKAARSRIGAWPRAALPDSPSPTGRRTFQQAEAAHAASQFRLLAGGPRLPNTQGQGW